MGKTTKSETMFWLVGQVRSGEFPNMVWEFQGIFDSEQKAKEACRNDQYFVAPVVLNGKIPDESAIFPDSFHPKKCE